MGVVLAVGPIAGQLFGAQRLHECGTQLYQAMWLALLMSVPGCALLAWPEPFLAIAQAPPAVADKVRAYLGHLAFALPSALLFTSFRGFNTAVSRPKVVMAVQLVGLAVKGAAEHAVHLRAGPAHPRRHLDGRRDGRAGLRAGHGDRQRRAAARRVAAAAARSVLRRLRPDRPVPAPRPREPGGAAAPGCADGRVHHGRGDRLHRDGALHLAHRHHARWRAMRSR